MTARSRMIHRARVERFTSPGDDDSGNPRPGSWSQVGSERIPIWLYSSREREAVTGATTAVVATLKALVPKTADVSESDHLGGSGQAAILDRLGNVIEAGVLGVEEVLLKRTHKQLTLSRVSS